MVDSDFGGLQPKSTEQKPAEAASKSILPAQPKPPAGKEEPPVAVAADFGSGAAPQLTDTAKPAYLRYTLPEQKLYTPVSVEYAGREEDAAENRRMEQTPPKALPNRIRDAGTAALPRDLYYVQPEEFYGTFSFRPNTAEPQTLEDLAAEIEKTKKAIEAADDALFQMGLESDDPSFTNTATYMAIKKEYDRLVKQYDQLNRQYGLWEQQDKYSGKTYEDDFWGQWGANFDVGALTETINAAYFSYLEEPTEENRAYAQELEKLFNDFLSNNALTLDDEGRVLPLLTSDLATYVPQWWNQQKAGISNGVSGAAVAALATAYTGIGAAPAASWGFKTGYSAGVGEYSYEQMSGAAYRELISWGIDDETARIAAMDEGVVSGFVEAADALGDLLTFGSGKILKLVNNKTAHKILDSLVKYGINIYTEGVEEGEQQAVSIANRDRILDGEYNKDAGWLERKFDLAGDTVNVLWNAYTGQDDAAYEEIHRASSAGRRLGLFSAGAGTASNALQNSYKSVNADQMATAATGDEKQVQTEQTTQTQTTNDHSPLERGIALVVDQYRKAVERFGSKAAQEETSADGLMSGNEFENAEEFEQSFLFGLQSEKIMVYFKQKVAKKPPNLQKPRKQLNYRKNP